MLLRNHVIDTDLPAIERIDQASVHIFVVIRFIFVVFVFCYVIIYFLFGCIYNTYIVITYSYVIFTFYYVKYTKASSPTSVLIMD